MDPELNAKINACSHIVLRDFHILESFFPPEILDLPLCDGLKKHPMMQSFINKIQEMQFYVNPFDILYTIVQFSNLLNRRIIEMQRKGQSVTEMSFDEFFPILLVFICVSDLQTIGGIKAFLDMSSEITTSPVFTYVYTSLSAVLEFICKNLIFEDGKPRLLDL